jgi:3-phenylpropionate/cinnamic acid dioxygenase small subunit
MQTDELYLECTRFLNREAELLDNRQFREWLGLLAADIDYRVPVRITPDRQSGVSPFSNDAFHMVEDWGSLKTRVARFETDYAWSEDPPSRTRRFVSNVRVDASRPDEVEVKSNLLLYRARGDAPAELICGERHDVLRQVEGQWKIAKRLVLLDHTSLPTQNLAVFL